MSYLCPISDLYAKNPAFYAEVSALYAKITIFYADICIFGFHCASNVHGQFLL